MNIIVIMGKSAMDEIFVEHVHSVIASPAESLKKDDLKDRAGIFNYINSDYYKSLKTKWDHLDERLLEIQHKMEEYSEMDLQIALLRIDEERIEIQQKLHELRGGVICLARAFTKISHKTVHLKLAQEHFETGNYVAAQTVLDAEELVSELDEIICSKIALLHHESKSKTDLIDKANEFLILAHLTALDHTLPGWYEKVIYYFEQSVKATHTAENTFAFALFMHQHNQLTSAVSLYEKALVLNRRLAEANPKTYLPELAKTLSSHANLQRSLNKVATAQAAYQEALGIYRKMEQISPGEWLEHMAETLDNLALSQKIRKKFNHAEASYQKLLVICYKLADKNPEISLHYVAGTLNNLALFQQEKRNYITAEDQYLKALSIYRTLAKSNPAIWLPEVAVTINNLAGLERAKNNFSLAKKKYHEVLNIYCQLVKINASIWLPAVAAVLKNLGNLEEIKKQAGVGNAQNQEIIRIYRRLAGVRTQNFRSDLAILAFNMSIFYMVSIPDKENSLAYARQALIVALPFGKLVPDAQNLIIKVVSVAEYWKLDKKIFIEEIQDFFR
jgi:tetratricopeptide (TPR) repeat protein